MKTTLTATIAFFAGVVILFAPPMHAVAADAAEVREVGAFDRIAASGAIDVVVRPGARESVRVEADAAWLPRIETVVEASPEGPRLAIRWRKGEAPTLRRTARVTVDVVHLAAVSMAGSGDLTLQALKTPALKVALAGAGDAALQRLDTDSLELAIAGSSDVVADGRAKRLALAIAGSGDAKLAALAADEVSVRIAGSGDADVQADKSLVVSIAGSGDVRHGGAATDVRSKIAGSGTVTRR